MKNLKYITLSLLLSNAFFVFSMENNNKIKKEISKEEQEKLNTKLLEKVWLTVDEKTNQIIKELIIQGADVNAKDEYGNTPLILTSKCWTISPNKGGHLNYGIAKTLLESGANVLIGNNKSESALDISLELLKGYSNYSSVAVYLKEYITFLEEAMYKVIYRLEILNKAIYNHDKKTLNNILNKYPKLVDIDGYNALHIAARDGNYLIFNYIWLIKPELFDKKNYDNKTATDEYPDIILYLILNKRLSLVKQNK